MCLMITCAPLDLRLLYILPKMKDERFKLDVKIRQCVLLNYVLDEFGYKCYDLMTKKLVRSQDVLFVEDKKIKDIHNIDRSITRSSNGLVDLNLVP